MKRQGRLTLPLGDCIVIMMKEKFGRKWFFVIVIQPLEGEGWVGGNRLSSMGEIVRG
jgi:hypothetical protein